MRIRFALYGPEGEILTEPWDAGLTAHALPGTGGVPATTSLLDKGGKVIPTWARAELLLVGI